MTHAVADRWARGDAYESYMGRWSRVLARGFLHWLRPAPRGHWLEVGCGTGALTGNICGLCDPASVVACEPSAPFLEHAQSNVADARVTFVRAAADALPSRDGGFDAIVSGLVLNFIAEPQAALAAMRARTRAGGSVAAYVWDYAGGLEFLSYFWKEAVALDAGAAEHDEAKRFGFWQTPKLEALFHGAGLDAVESAPVEIETQFADFDDFWAPFLGGTGPAPSYVSALDAARRDQLRERLDKRLPARPIRLKARALAVRGRAER